MTLQYSNHFSFNYIVTQVLNDLNQEHIYYCPNPGNAGDSLIAMATYQLFEKLDLNYSIVSWNTHEDLKNKIVVYGGGGNIIPNYHHARSFIFQKGLKAKKLIILPHTISGHNDLLNQLKANTEIFVREKESFKNVKQSNCKASIHLSHDLALGLNSKKIFQEVETLNLNKSRNHSVFFKIKSFSKKMISLIMSKKDTLNCYRQDSESKQLNLPSDNVDVSKLFIQGVDRKNALIASYMMLKYIDQFKIINTDRLHCCIAGLLLGKKVNFYANNYYKCKAVYEHSLKQNYSNLFWREKIN